MPDAGVREELAGPGVVDHGMDVDRDRAVRLLGEALGLHLARDRLELPRPVLAHRVAADDPSALPGIGPVDVLVHELDRRVDVAGVEGVVGGAEGLLQRRARSLKLPVEGHFGEPVVQHSGPWLTSPP